MKRDARPLWQPGPDEFEHSNLARFARRNGFDPQDYETLHRWSISELEGFWNALWEFAGVIGTRGEVTLERAAEGEMFGARWYPGGALNFAENLLVGDDARLAIIEADETGVRARLSMGALRERVARAQHGLRALGVGRGDCVAGILPNQTDALVALLATASIGAIWASCSPDFGAPGIVDRVGQVQPKVVIAARAYTYNGKRFCIDDNLRAVLAAMPGVEHLVVTRADAAALSDLLPDSPVPCLTWDALCASSGATLSFERVPFSHPLYVMFTSGTTGLPKGIVHTAGGVLLQHRKEHLMHCDVRPGDVMSWYTNTAWMMYHWVISGLASHAAVVLYDGAPIVRREDGLDHGVLWRVAEQAGTTHFGTSPRYLGALAEAGYEPGRRHDLRALRSVLSAGAPVAPEQFDWLYAAVRRDMMFASISGGTEIIGCFVLGSPLHAVYRGEIACKGLGLAVDVLDERGASVIGRKGDLVCTEPFPSAPLTFWGENGDARYRAAYFEARPGIWTHGDLAEQTMHGAVVIYGRTDTTLKPGGVRIGTAEIYRVIDAQPEIQDCIVFGRPVGDDEEIVLCVVLKDGHALDDALVQRLRAQVRKQASPRHVPHAIHAVSAVPYTINGKRVEGAARAVVSGAAVKNLGSLANPECLAEFAALYAKETA
jgi:acetoacetyl-CoA synthetase